MWGVNHSSPGPGLDISSIIRLSLLFSGLVLGQLPNLTGVATTGSTDNSPSTIASTPLSSLVDRQSALRVMVVGDSMSQGQEGDYTWRYRIWQFFQQNGIDVDMVGPYHGTMPPDAATPSSLPPLHGPSPSPNSPRTTGTYASDVDSAFLSNCNHFSAWAVAVDKGLIQGVLQSTPADLILYMLGFNDIGWFYSDAAGTIDNVKKFVTNARAANPDIKIAMANVPQRSFMEGREDLVQNTKVYNTLLANYIPQWSTAQSPIHLVHLQENYDCQPGGCPAGSDGLHPNAWGEFQIANAFSHTLVNDFGLGKNPIAVPARDDPRLADVLP
ncbi:uncharacterized protein E0L32_007657 [Thyridium curvatum]|uniref:Uncharacterized protein n=1 Tax=Thyridium curvatum TaxID=1093900 RepID=A0A507B487_9PEZI|nr:uncharacterized protein E0L32_007657 [Thyridium curvatum]TPX11678.1 hypothetical protein E0L32_007657 [Thyridium curvatum]